MAVKVIKMQMRDKDVPKMLNGKCMTGRPVERRLHCQKWHKVISDRRLGAFGEVFVERSYVFRFDELTKKHLKMLGYESLDEYMAEPFNKGAKLSDEKRYFVWSRFNPNKRVIKQILAKK